nr:hypothetical protein [Micromonospora sp. DSM 115978]
NLGLGLDLAGWAARLLAVAVVAGCALAVRRRGGDERLLFTGTVVAALLASPIVWAHYLLLLLVPVLVVATADAPSAAGAGAGAQQQQQQRQRRLAADAPLAAFAVSSWLVVTPHKSDLLDVAAAAVVV